MTSTTVPCSNENTSSLSDPSGPICRLLLPAGALGLSGSLSSGSLMQWAKRGVTVQIVEVPEPGGDEDETLQYAIAGAILRLEWCAQPS